MEFKTTTDLDDVTAAMDSFRSAVAEEKAIAQQCERLVGEFGKVRSQHAALHFSLTSLRGQHASDALLENFHAIVETLAARQKDLESLRFRCEVYANALHDVDARRSRAAEQVSLAMNTLRKHALELLEMRYGKKRSFSWWNDAKAETYEWRRSILWQLLAFASNNPEHGCALLKSFFAESAGFALTVRRGFWITGEAGLREIRPTADGEVYAVPKDLGLREAFEAALTGRADLVAA
jgi:hypothetical protein